MRKQVLTETQMSPVSLLSGFEKNFPEINFSQLEVYWLHRQITAKIESEMDAMLSGSGLSSGRFVLMILLDRYPEGLRPTELAQLAGVTQATISGLLISLEKAGLSQRKIHQSDGRSYVIQLSDAGHNLYKKLQPSFLNMIRQFFSGLENTEVQALKDVLTKMGTQAKQTIN